MTNKTEEIKKQPISECELCNFARKHGLYGNPFCVKCYGKKFHKPILESQH